MPIIQLPHSAISVTIIKKPIKNMNLRISRDGVVRMSIPIRYSIQHAEAFLNEKEAWITSHLARIKTRQVRQDSRESGEACIYLGKTYPLKIHEYQKGHSVQLEANHLACFVKSSAASIDKLNFIKHWQRCQMQALMPALIAKWEPIIGVHVAEWGIKAMTSRWGSCNPLKGRIWLNFHLIKKPIVCLEYVLVHEMVHLLEASHNQRFYALMSQFMPKWKEHKQLLNAENSLL